MPIRILAVGDVTTRSGLEFLEKELRPAKREMKIDFTVVNGENAAGLGLTPSDAERIYSSGADVITLGNHSFSRRELISYIDDDRFMLRPANLSNLNPGRGFGIFDGPRGTRIAVINLIGRVGMDRLADDPFYAADSILRQIDTPITIVDFHAEATSEKAALARYLDGRVSAVFGTHTHVQTADEQILPGGTGFITDIGMTGPVNSILGMDISESVRRLLGAPPSGYHPAPGPSRLHGAVFEISPEGKCLSIERVSLD